ncbi:LytR family transcriptional regulator [Eggerthella sinensis]|uniref:LytR family transcriptional regulator n=2 Tax=Eggerthella sinensis TaxID=242230 RepID=A0A3N0IZY4_9ACTN|nr:LytR family transcriptional regulator [Eggerthella sinensis]RNM42477.1 LytR family transcriptional regulator [Eggerthella sinensis]
MILVKLKRIACMAVAVCGVFALLLLSGCQQQEAAPSETATDVQLMQEAGKSTEDPFYVLVVGNDSRKGTTEIENANYADGTGRSDTMMLARVDPETYRVTLVSIARDTEATLDGSVVKINEIYRQGGIDAAIAEVEKLTGVHVRYYLDMGFVGFENFVNEIGGITANVPIDLHLKDIVGGDKIVLSAGTQELNGPQALVLARVRKLYAADIEACRQIQDRQIVEAGIKQVAADPANAAAHVDTLLANADTNWPTDELAAMVADFAAHADEITVLSGTGPYVGDFMEEYDGLWLTPRDEDTWKKVMQVVDEGGDPTTVVPLPEVEAA